MEILKHDKAPKLDKLEAAKILNNIFEECNEVPNTVPMEELESYSSFKKENLTVQRSILVIATVIFLVLPIFFIAPKYTITSTLNTDRSLFAYTIDISTFLPVKSVTAVMNGRRLPVYCINKHKYSVEPTANGQVQVTVTLFSGQRTVNTINFISADNEPPQYLGYKNDSGKFWVYLKDEGSGLNLEKIYATAENGEVIAPGFFDEKSGEVAFDRDISGLQLYVEDNFGNGVIYRISK